MYNLDQKLQLLDTPYLKVIDIYIYMLLYIESRKLYNILCVFYFFSICY